ncbi:MAG: SIMPL domain-containing protein [Thermomicrobiales bacterium]|nr:SIMPL domain-containing protein [Thermomicrobiales bacterium]
MLQDRNRAARALRTAGISLAVIGLLAGPATATIASAQDLATPAATNAAGLATVSVSGHGQVNVAPDTASVNVGVDIIKPTLGEAQETAANQATAVIDALKATGIAAEDIQTDFFSVNILRDYSENADPTKITGFEIVNQLQVTVRDTSKLSDVLDAAVTAGANNIYGVTFYVEDQTAAASKARAEAVKDARTKAEELASAAGMTLGPVVAISEGAAPMIPGPYPMARGGAGMAMEAAATPVEPGSTTVSVDVSVTYELR